MRSLRWIWITVGVVVGIVVLGIAVGALWLNSFIHSDAFRQEVESRASQSLGEPVQIETINFDIFHGVKLNGLVTQVSSRRLEGHGTLMVNVASANCTYDWAELFNRKLKLTGVNLDKPQIVLTRQAVAPLPPTESANTPGTPTQTTSSAATGEAPATSSTASTPPFQFVLDRAKVSDGTITMRDAAGATTVSLQGINVQANTSGYTEGKDVTGTANVSDLALPSNMHVTDFSTSFTYGHATLEAKPMAAKAFGGNIAGAYLLTPNDPSILDLNAKGFDMTQLTAATSSRSSAKLSGSLDVQSKWKGVETGEINGEGDAQLVNGKLENVKILQNLSQIFRIKELDAPIISKAVTHFTVANSQTVFTGLQIDSPIFRITGNGAVGFNGAVNANLVLFLSRDAMAKIPSQAAASFVQQPDGSGSIAFHVSGTTAHPETDLATRLLMQNTQIKNVIDNALKKFFK